MPEEGIDFVNRKDLLSYEEILRLIKILTGLGVEKVRFTGGEPFIRKNFYGFLKRVAKIKELKNVSITTNGAVANRHLPLLKELGIASLNLSLDTLDKEKFKKITRRDFFDEAISTYHSSLDIGLPLSINMVVMGGINDEDIIPMAMLTVNDPVTVRFIEEMPFNGTGYRDNPSYFNHTRILEQLKKKFPSIRPLKRRSGATASTYIIDGHKGKVGIIAAWSRTFCGDCNRIRITATGEMRNCLYGEGVLNLKSLIEEGFSDNMIKDAIHKAYNKKYRNGHESEKQRQESISESMSSIGG